MLPVFVRFSVADCGKHLPNTQCFRKESSFLPDASFVNRGCSFVLLRSYSHTDEARGNIVYPCPGGVFADSYRSESGHRRRKKRENNLRFLSDLEIAREISDVASLVLISFFLLRPTRSQFN